MNTSDKSPSKPADLNQLDALTGGVFTAPTSGERAARLRDWLATEPTPDAMAEVYRELSVRDKGAAKGLKEKLDELKRAQAQDAIAAEWAAKAQVLLEQSKFNLGDAMAWQRDAAKAGAPLSREPLAGLKQALAERMKGLEDLQHRVQVEGEAAVLLAQRIEVLSTKPWAEAQATLEALRADVNQWQQLAEQLQTESAWASLEPKFHTRLASAREQLVLVWTAFEAALAQAVAAAADATAPLPAVPVWADELRVLRGEVLPVAETASAATSPAVAAESAAAQAQRAAVDAVREQLLTQAVALTQSPEGQKLGGRKVQETLRALREQWKAADQGNPPNHGLWKKFDEACNQAHKVVEAWLGKLKEQNEANRGQRLALLEEVKTWTQAHAESSDWKAQLRDLHAFAERWRQSGHLSEKLFAELQPQWKAVIRAAHVRLEAAQADSLARRQALIAEAQALGAAPSLRIDAVKALQQRWQQEAHSVPLDRKQEQKLWEAFRKPLDEAFERKSAEREKTAEALSPVDKAVLDAAKALDAANASGDAQKIRAAVADLQAAARGQAMAAAEPVSAVAPAAPAADAVAVAETPEAAEAATAEAASDAEVPATPAAEIEVTEADEAATPAALAPVKAAPAKKLVAVRGDDRPGMQKTTPAVAGGRMGRDGKPGERRGPRDERPGRDGRDARGNDRFGAEARGPRLGDAAFRAQRQALEHAELALKKLASQAHGEVLTQLLTAWEKRDAAAVPAAQALGGRAAGAGRAQWVQVLEKAPAAADQAAQSLLRLEMAAEVPTPAEQLEARRAMQLQLLTRRNDPAPADTWVKDAAQVLASAHNAAAARRLQAVLKVLLRR